MITYDAVIGDVLPGPKPVLEPIPEAKSLPDGFRYKPDLADLSGQALHFEQCIDWVRDLSEKQVRKIIKTLHKKYVSLPYQNRPGWRFSKSPLKFDGDVDDDDALRMWVNDWKLVNKCIDNQMKAEIMMASLTSMAESQLHNIFAVAKTGVSYAIKISASDKLVKSDVAGTSHRWSVVRSRLRELGGHVRRRLNLPTD